MPRSANDGCIITGFKSGFATATLVLGIMGIVLPAVNCGIVALGQIRGGSYSGRGMVMARLLIRAAWVFLVAAFAAYVVIVWPG